VLSFPTGRGKYHLSAIRKSHNGLPCRKSPGWACRFGFDADPNLKCGCLAIPRVPGLAQGRVAGIDGLG